MNRAILGLLALSLAFLPGCGAVGAWFRRRGLDLLDCVKANVGVGLGLEADARLTDWFAPGLGFAARTWNFGWEDRNLYGSWEEWNVVNTPRAVWEANVGDIEESTTEPGYDPRWSVARLAMASVFLANERWIRKPGTGVVRIELYSLFNFAPIPTFIRAADPRRSMIRSGETAVINRKSIWDQGWIELGVTPVFLHVRAGLNPFQMVDFLFGMVGLDPAGDDRDRIPSAPPLPVLEESPSQRKRR